MDTNKTTLRLNPTIRVGENYNFIELNFIISHTPHRLGYNLSSLCVCHFILFHLLSHAHLLLSLGQIKVQY